MKKNFVLTLLCCLIAFGSAIACTNFIVTKGASKDGSCFVTYAADSHQLYGELYYRPAADYPAGTKNSARFRRWHTPILLSGI